MKIIRAEHLGMCFGVRDAIQLAEQEARERPVTILGELVHNPVVLDRLREQGIRIEPDLDRVETGTVMITAHGVSERRRREVEQRGFRVLESTCPLVHVAHRAVGGLVSAGYHPVIVGKRDHVEVRGLTEDLEEFDVILEESDIDRLRERPRFGVAAQTTQPVERVRYLVSLLRTRFPESEIRFVDTVCQPTKQRQHAAVELAQRCDVVIVIGGANSNNTRELVESCRRHCARVHPVQQVDQLRAEWIQGAATVGLTAGTSTPEVTLHAVEQRLVEWAVERQPGAGSDGRIVREVSAASSQPSVPLHQPQRSAAHRV
jgi:4-hydroxy-3-methylbut-2-en-1-yl diphosphate reductase